jgi:ATP-dependent Clp protease ATP-binding subunit ClpA
MFEIFDPQCFRALRYADEESRKLRVNWVCAVQILLGISRMMGTDLAAAIVLSGFKPEEVRLQLRKILADRRENVGDIIPFTETAKTIFHAAVNKAKARSIAPHVSMADLLLAVIDNPNDLLVDSVIDSGTHWGTFREELRKRVQVAANPLEGMFVNCKFLGRELNGDSREVLQVARSELQSQSGTEIGTEHILLGIFQVDSSVRMSLNEVGVLLPSIRKKLQELREEVIEQSASEEMDEQSTSKDVQEPVIPELEIVCKNASLMAQEEAKAITPRHIMQAILTIDCLARRALDLEVPQITKLFEQLTKERETPN